MAAWLGKCAAASMHLRDARAMSHETPIGSSLTGLEVALLLRVREK